jgi:hypothetical protein
MKYIPLWMAMSLVAITLEVASSQEPQIIADPPEIIDPPWLESRGHAQLATTDQYEIFYQFNFSDQIVQSGIRFHNKIVDDSGKYWQPVHYDHGNGVAVADVDGDGLHDLYFVNQVGSNQLWKNQGDGTFTDMTETAGVGLAELIGVTSSFADIDNDGDPDLYVTTVREGNHLFENDGEGHFKDISAASGLDYKGYSSGAIFFDYNRDGALDLFLTNVGTYTSDTLMPSAYYAPGLEAEEYDYYVGLSDAFSGHLFPARFERSLLFKNLGDKRFVDVTTEVKLEDTGWTGDATPIDANEDGWVDLYVLNMQGNDQYYENVQGQYFAKKSREVFPKTPWGAMGVKAFDYNNDGHMDLYVTDMHSDMSEKIGPEREKLKANVKHDDEFLRSGGNSIFGNAFYRNTGNGHFEEISDQIGAENYWPWGLSVGDLNADGYEDVFITSSMNSPWRYGVNSLLLNNKGSGFLDSEFILGVEPRRDGRTAKPWFELDCSNADQHHRLCKDRSGHFVVWGALGSRSSVIFDLDGDGDLDIVTNEFNAEPMVLISDLSAKRDIRFLKVRLTGSQSNRDGLGATIAVKAGGQTYTKVHDGQSGYLSQSLYPLYFGLGDATTVEQIEVRWPSGQIQTVPGPLEVNTLIEVREQ